MNDFIGKQFLKSKKKKSDIHEHIETLYHYAKQCSHITELGVRMVVSTWAFLQGLKDNDNSSKKLISVDLEYSRNLESVKKESKKAGISFVFIMANDIQVTLEPTDLLFIDTWHIYGHLKRELEKHGACARKYIILHDTKTDGDDGESVRRKWDIPKQAIETGYQEEEIQKGLMPAIDEFLALNKNRWSLHKTYENCNGLTILKRML